ncbi:MAG: hypothetical protein ACREAY_01805 [Nitrososphaera sp.]|uniref:hypothetical protein n=1 Tax=Nitrososphaera sp. TaxID=1971748 RepID=UPI003D6E42C5
MALREYAKYGGITAAIFAVFVVLAQAQAISVPFFTPATIRVNGLGDNYGLNGDATFTITAHGYGSNCHALQVEAVHDGERKSFYRKADDCRYMEITHGPYNFTRSFEYGSEVLSSKGEYKLDVRFEDLVDGRKASLTRNFSVGTE